MQTRTYRVEVEIAGRLAMFKRPDAPVSYPVPTPTAAEGIFRTVAWIKTARIRPVECRICAPVRYVDYGFNHRGPLRNSKQIANDTTLQLKLKLLFQPCFQLIGEVEEFAPSPWRHNQSHHLQEMFTRRLQRGQFGGHQLCLGTADCFPSYVGPFRPETKTVDHNEFIHGFLVKMWSEPADGELQPVFRPLVEIKNGVLSYD